MSEETAIEIDDAAQLQAARALAVLHESPVRIPVRAVVTDFDGVHTDDTAIIDADGGERVRVSREDGMGVSLLRRAGVPMLILSTEVNSVVRARADKLRVPVLHGIADKEAALRQWAQAQDVALADIAYLGNDVNDLPAMRVVAGRSPSRTPTRSSVRRRASCWGGEAGKGPCGSSSNGCCRADRPGNRPVDRCSPAARTQEGRGG